MKTTGKIIAIGAGVIGAAALLMIFEGTKGNATSRAILAQAKQEPAYRVQGELVSVVIPTYVEEAHIADTLSAIQNQTYSPIETVISDDSNSESMIDTLVIGDRYDATFAHTYIKNISMGRNLGARAANADILIFLDADCIMASDFVEKLVADLNIDGVKLSHGVDVWHGKDDILLQGRRVIWNHAIKPFYYTTGRGVAIRASDFREIGGYNEDIDPMKVGQREDTDLGKRVRDKWGASSIFFDRSACVSEPTRRPMSMPGMPAWQARAWRDGKAID